MSVAGRAGGGRWAVVVVGAAAALQHATAQQSPSPPSTPAVRCPLPTLQAGEQRLGSGAVEVAWRADPATLAVGRPFAVEVRVCPAAARVIRVDATMLEHRHGMNYRPSVKSLGEGRWRAEGLLWHMSGRWELAIEVDNGGERTWLRQSVVLP